MPFAMGGMPIALGAHVTQGVWGLGAFSVLGALQGVPPEMIRRPGLGFQQVPGVPLSAQENPLEYKCSTPELPVAMGSRGNVNSISNNENHFSLIIRNKC